jgi:hypothetical protein
MEALRVITLEVILLLGVGQTFGHGGSEAHNTGGDPTARRWTDVWSWRL